MADKRDRTTVNPDGADTEETQVDGTPSSPRRGDDTTWTGQDDDEAGTRPHAGSPEKKMAGT